MTTRRELFSVTTRISSEVTDALQKATSRTIWALSENHRFRLYRLWIWSQRYSVSLEYILGAVIPYFVRGVEKRTGKRSKGLGISIPVLTGDVAEEVLQKAIERDFPDNEHISLHREQEQDRIALLLETPPEFPVKIKKPLQFKTPSAEAEAYAKTVNKEIRKSSSLENKFRKIPWRGNPWR